MPILLKAAVGALLLSANGGAFGRSLLKEDATSVTDLFTTKPQVCSDLFSDHRSWRSSQWYDWRPCAWTGCNSKRL